jgi:hypothetical protein
MVYLLLYFIRPFVDDDVSLVATFLGRYLVATGGPIFICFYDEIHGKFQQLFDVCLNFQTKI